LERYPRTNLEGDYQRWNAATTTLAARALPAAWRIAPAIVDRGLMQVDWPGRWQRIRVGGRLVVLDASHNPEGAEVLDANLRRLVQEIHRAPIVVVGVLGSARAQPLIDIISRHAGEIRLVMPNQPRACGYEELEALVPSGYTGQVKRSKVSELFPNPGTCTIGTTDDVIVVTGSIYLLGEIIPRLVQPRTDNG
jgi:dihydrofolate synthase/folylpolyglutamate synthase